LYAAPSDGRVNQTSQAAIKLGRRSEEAILNIFESKLNAKLKYLLLLHLKQVELLQARLDQQAVRMLPR
jgi:hypothetical protein